MKIRHIVPAVSLLFFLSACGHAEPNKTNENAIIGGEGRGSSSSADTGRFVASELPEVVIVNAKFEERMGPGAVEDDDGSTFTWLMANIPETRYSVPINDFIYLGKAATKEFTSPRLNGCKLTSYTFDYVGPGNQILNFGARDAKGSKACQNFFAAIARDGLHMEFTDVPLLNGRGVAIKKVILNITAR